MFGLFKMWVEGDGYLVSSFLAVSERLSPLRAMAQQNHPDTELFGIDQEIPEPLGYHDDSFPVLKLRRMVTRDGVWIVMTENVR